VRRADKIAWEKRRLRRLQRGVCLYCGNKAVASWKCHLCDWRHIVCQRHRTVFSKMALSGHMNKHSPKAQAYHAARRAHPPVEARPSLLKLIEDATVEVATLGTVARLLALAAEQIAPEGPEGPRLHLLVLITKARQEAERAVAEAVGRVTGQGRER
jgi:hypothetical protein